MRGSISWRIVCVLSVAMAILGLSAGTARATDLTWDIVPGIVGPGDSGITGGSGIWDDANGNWTTDGGANNVAWDNTLNANDTAVFRGTAGTVTLGTGVTAGGLIFNTNNYILSGAGTLTLSGATPTIATGNGITAAIGSNTATVIDGTVGLTKRGVGTLSLNGSAVNTFTGGLNAMAARCR